MIFARQPFGNRGFPDAGVTHVKRVVLGTAAQDLDRPVNLGPAPDQRIGSCRFPPSR